MIDPRICPACGGRDDRPRLASAEPARLRCSACNHERDFRRLPLLCLTGPSGAGKSTVARLVGEGLERHVVTLEQDVLWTPELAERPGGVDWFRATWLRLAAMIGQSGRPVLLCGTVVPVELEPLPERVLFRRIDYLALLVEPDVLAARLRTRPSWRGWDEERIVEMVEFAERLRRTASTMEPPVEVLETSGLDAAATAARVRSWVLRRLEASRPSGPAASP